MENLLDQSLSSIYPYLLLVLHFSNQHRGRSFNDLSAPIKCIFESFLQQNQQVLERLLHPSYTSLSNQTIYDP